MSFRRFPVRFGRYILLDRIAAGGMAEVHRAKATGVESFQRLLAIKTMLPTLTESEDFVRMFVEEAKLASQLNHPNIIQIHELGRLDDVLFIAMELVSGRDVGHILRVTRAIGQPIPVTFATYVVAKAAEGLDFAHHKTDPAGRALNLVHRDVSPQNILVSYDGEVKVGDFGIAKSDIRAVKTVGGVVKGKIPYMAPEQVTGKDLDRRTDIFALGTVFYELLTGQQLFRGASQFDLMAVVRDAQVPPVSFRYPHVPETMEAVLRRALARDPADRYQTADELAQALNTFLIDGGTLYGSRHAALYMDQLFHDEVDTAHEQQRQYAAMTGADCHDDSIRPQRTELFQTDFESAPTRLQTVAEPYVPTATTDLVDLGGPTVPLKPGELPSTLRRFTLPVLTLRRAVLIFGSALLLAVAVALFLLRADPEANPPPAPSVAVVPSPKPVEAPVPTRPAANPTVPAALITTPVAVPPTKVHDPPPPRFGFLSLRADGVTAAKVLIDNTDIGYSPVIAVKVTPGRHKVRIVEETPAGPGRVRDLEINVTAKHTLQDPLRLIVPIQGFDGP